AVSGRYARRRANRRRGLLLDLAAADPHQRQQVRAHRLAVRGRARHTQADRRGRRDPRTARRGHLPRPRRRTRLLLQQRDRVAAPARVRASPASRRVGAHRNPRGTRPRALRVRTAHARARDRAPDQMKLPAPFDPWEQHLAIDLPGARVVFTTRRGGVSSGPYASLNLGRMTPDDPDAVTRNRDRIQQRVGGRLAMIRQGHGSHGELEEADGQATARPGLAPMVLTADCLAIAVAGGGALAILHAGWRGLAEGVLDEGVGAVRELAHYGPLEAAIGPGAGRCCYEVGEEVHEQFAAYGER